MFKPYETEVPTKLLPYSSNAPVLSPVCILVAIAFEEARGLSVCEALQVDVPVTISISGG